MHIIGVIAKICYEKKVVITTLKFQTLHTNYIFSSFHFSFSPNIFTPISNTISQHTFYLVICHIISILLNTKPMLSQFMLLGSPSINVFVSPMAQHQWKRVHRAYKQMWSKMYLENEMSLDNHFCPYLFLSWQILKSSTKQCSVIAMLFENCSRNSSIKRRCTWFES